MHRLKNIFLLVFFILILPSSISVYAASSFISKVESGKNADIGVTLPEYGINMDNISSVLKNVRTAAKNQKAGYISKVKSEMSGQGRSQAEQTYAGVKSAREQKLLSKFETQMLGKGEFGQYIPKRLDKIMIRYYKKPHWNFTKRRLFLFVSSSMPMITLRRYAGADFAVGAPVQMVMRGFIGSANYVMPTMNFIERVIKAPNSIKYYAMHVDIDPIYFSKYGITRVPALVYVRNFNPKTYLSNYEQAFVLYGDTGLRDGIRILERETGSKYLKQVLEKFRRNQFFH